MADEEISYQSATRDVLLTAAKVIGSQCVDANLAFTKCKAEHSDPQACLKLGAEVLECNNRVLREISSKCPEQFEEFRKCLDKSQINYGLCRSQEKAFRDAFGA